MLQSTSGALCYFQNNAINDLKERNETILSHYDKVLSLESSTMHEVSEIDYNRIIEEFHLTPTQSMTFQLFIKD